MARTPPRRTINGTRTNFIPMTSDSILLHHLLETQRVIIQTQQRHAREIERLSTQMSNKRRRKRIEDIPPWVFWAWGCAMLVLTKFSPEAAEAIERVAKLAAAFR